MYDRFINNGVNFICRYVNSDENTREIYGYGLELLLISVFNTIVMLVIGAVSNHFWETVLLLFAFYPLQIFGGGYHAQTYLHCFFLFFSGWVLAVLVIPYIQVNYALIYGSAVLGAVTIFLLAPIEHVNFPMSDGKKKRMRRIVRLFAFSYCILVAALNAYFGLHRPAAIFGIVLFLSGLSMLSAFIKQMLLKNKPKPDESIAGES